MSIEAVLDHALNNDFNVLLSGKHGVGKTALVKQCFEDAGLNWQYFSASTMDPWVDLIGVPKEIDGKLALIRPASIDYENVEAIFLDEYNRSHKKIRNAVMELIQFGSINGHRLPNLKIVWAAINPDNDEDFDYDVDKLDGAQIDRFHVHINVPYEPCMRFFRDRYGSQGVSVVKWWKNLNKETRLLCSPRRLEYALNVVMAKGDARYVLDSKLGIPEFTSAVELGDPVETLDAMMGLSDDEIRKKLEEANVLRRLEQDLVGKIKYIERMAHLMPEEVLIKALAPKGRGSKLVTFIVSNPGKFAQLADGVLMNEQSYTMKAVTAFKNFQRLRDKGQLIANVSRVDRVSIPGHDLVFRDMAVCLTGSLSDFTRDTATSLMKSHGIRVSRGVDAYTTHLVVGTKPGNSKLDAGKQRGCTILDQSDWSAMVRAMRVTPSASLVTINDREVDVNEITLHNFAEKTGSQFRITKEQSRKIQLGTLDRAGALREFLAKSVNDKAGTQMLTSDAIDGERLDDEELTVGSGLGGAS